MQIGITGVLGVVGTQLVKRFVEKGIAYKGLDTRAQFSDQRGDICNFEDVHDAFKDCDGIVHLAGVSAPEGKELDPNLAHKVNVLGTLNVIESVIRTASGIAPQWLLYISCYQVYGKQSRFPVSEWMRPHPSNALGISKLLSEELVQSKCTKFTIPYGILRLSHVYGSERTSALTSFPNSLIQQALNGASLIYPNKNSTYDFVHVEDVVEAIVTAIGILQSTQKPLPLMNICSGIETHGGDLVKKVQQLTHTVEEIKMHSYNNEHGERFVGSREIARSTLGWAPKIQLDEGLKRAYHALQYSKP